jgi:hypothetical protein
MARLGRKTEEQKQEIAARKEQERRETEERKRLERIEKAKQAFFATPAGRARLAYENGDHVFQYQFDVMSQQAIIVVMVGSTTAKKTRDPVDVLNSVCHEGWELLTGSFVFVHEGSQSRDKFMSSGQNLSVKGKTVGYYLFKRSEANRREPTRPWEEPEEIQEESPEELAQLIAAESSGTDTGEQAFALVAGADGEEAEPAAVVAIERREDETSAPDAGGAWDANAAAQALAAATSENDGPSSGSVG